MRLLPSDLPGSCPGVPRRRLAASILLMLGLLLSPAVGDVFHLASGGKLEGELLEEDGQHLRIRTVLGTVTLTADAVERIEPAPTPFDEYEQRRARVTDTAADHITLAEWCGDNGLRRERRHHLERALEIDRDNITARRALGYVRVGDLWIDGRRVIEPNAAAPDEKPGDAAEPAEDPEKLVAAIQGSWRRRISAVKTALLNSSMSRQVEKGRQQIQAIRDPLAIVPLVEVLSTGSLSCRQILVEALSRFPDDAATVNLAALALADPHRRVRGLAIAELVRRRDPRVTGQLRKAVESGDDVLVRRAAEALGALRALEAVPELVNALKARRRKLVEVPVRRYFDALGTTFTRNTMHIGSMAVPVNPVVGVANPASLIEMERRVLTVTVFRSEVRDALRQISGTDFGFDQVAWARWYKEQGS